MKSMSENISAENERPVLDEKMSQEKVSAQENEQPNKGFSFIVGICIGIAIIALFVLLFPN
jgi:hypothetical protein